MNFLKKDATIRMIDFHVKKIEVSLQEYCREKFQRAILKIISSFHNEYVTHADGHS
jgi:hypothetical protein